MPTIQEEIDVTSVQPTSTEKDSQKPDHTCPTCTKGVRTGVHCGAYDDKWFHFRCERITKEEAEEQCKEEEEYECRSDRIKRNLEVKRELNRLQKVEIKYAEIAKALKTAEESLQAAREQLAQQQNKINLQSSIIMKLDQERQRMQKANKQLKTQLKETNRKVETTKESLSATEASVAKLRRRDNQKLQQEIVADRNHNKTLKYNKQQTG